MKKALALILVLIMLCTALVPVVSAATPATINLQELFADNGYASTYVGKALSGNDARPQQDGVINPGEYQKEYVVSKDGSKDTYRAGSSAAVPLRNDYKEYVSHDEDWIYFAVDFQSCVKSTTNFYWNLSFIDSFEFDYVGGTAANTAFTQNGRGIKEGWLFGTRFDTTSTNLSNAVPANKTVPVENTDYVLASSKENLGEALADNWPGYFNFRNIHEIKISKAWYADQVGITKENVRELAWFTYAEAINSGASSYTHIAHLPSTNVLSALETEGGAAYTGTASNTSTNSDKVLPRFFILDDEPEAPDDRLDLKAIYDSNGYASTYVGKALADGDAKPVQDGVIGATEYQKMRVVSKDGSSSIRWGAAAPLMREYKEYISHDDEWIYVAFDFIAGGATTQFNYFLSFIDSFEFNYYGGADVNNAFQQNGRGINAGWNLNAVSTQTNSPVKYGETGLTVNAGDATHNTDFDIAGTNAADTTTHAKAQAHQVYEIKISKAWYAAKAGLNDASEVKNVAWFTSMAQINVSSSSWTHVGHVISDADRAALKAAGDVDYTGVSTGGSQVYNGILPHFFILDESGTDWEQFAKDNKLTVNVKPVTEVPVIDGIIGATEYPSTRTINVTDLYNYNADEVQGTEVVEYFGHDAEYIYYAAQFTQSRTGTRAYWMQFKPNNTFDVFNDSFNARIRYNSRYAEEEDGTNVSYVNDIDNANGGAWTLPENEKDMFFYATKDANSVKTYEFKFSKAYIAALNGIGLDDVKVIPYYVSFHAVSAVGGTFTSDLKTAIAVAGGVVPSNADSTPCYYFMSLEDGDLLKVEDRLAINTQEKASIRLSPSNAGLRFKSVISTVDLKALMSKYDYIKVGTLIAPEDFGLDLSTVLNNNELVAGTNYINVEADVDNPFGSDRAINVFAGSITNINPNNIARDFAAVGYIAYSADGVNWTYVYSEVTAVRSVQFVAQAAADEREFEGNEAALDILRGFGATIPEPLPVEPEAPEAN